MRRKMEREEKSLMNLSFGQKSELSSHQISLQPQLRTKIRAELSSNLYARELRTAGLTPHFHAELL